MARYSHDEYEKSAPRRKRRGKLWLIPVIALILAAAVFALFKTVLIYADGGVYLRSAERLDLREKKLSRESYEKLASELPDCEILWSVPIGGDAFESTAETISPALFTEADIPNLSYFTDLKTIDAVQCVTSPELYEAIRSACPDTRVIWGICIGEERFPSSAEEITIHSLTADEISLFSYFENLRRVSGEGCDNYAALLALREALPSAEVSWQVPLGSDVYSSDAESISVSGGVSEPQLEAALAGLPQVKTVQFISDDLDTATKLALIEKYPEISFDWTMTLLGAECSAQDTELSFAGRTVTEAEYTELSEKLAFFPELESVDLTDTGLSEESLRALADRYPDIRFIWKTSLFGKEFSTADTYLDFTGIAMDSTEPVEAILPYMRSLEKVDMTDTGFDDETLQAMNERCAPVRVVWTMHLDPHYDVRTDDTGFITSFDFYGILTPESLHRFKYCPDMLCADLGHRITFQDISGIAEMPQLKYLLLADCWAQDISVVTELPNLIYLEMIIGQATDLSPLLKCKNLLDLNVCWCHATDPQKNLEIFKQMTQLERLWISAPMIPEGTEEELRAALPDTEIQIVTSKYDCTALGWRYHERYYEMRDLLGVFYMEEFGGRQHSKTIDGVVYPLSEEFLAGQKNVVHIQGHTDFTYE